MAVAGKRRRAPALVSEWLPLDRGLLLAVDRARVISETNKGNLVADAKLHIDLAEVMADGIGRAAEPHGDLLGGQTFAIPTDDLGLALLERSSAAMKTPVLSSESLLSMTRPAMKTESSEATLTVASP